MVHYKLYYFNMTGLGEPLRMLLSYGGLEFEDVRVPRDDWKDLKPKMPLRQMPVLEVDGKQLYQFMPIARYLGNVVGLAGNDAWENVQIDIVAETISDFRKELSKVFGLSKEEKAVKIEELSKDFLPFYLGKLNDFAVANNGYLAVGRLTWADFYLAAFVPLLKRLAERDVLEDYPGLKEVEENVLKQEKVKAYIAKRPVTDI